MIQATFMPTNRLFSDNDNDILPLFSLKDTGDEPNAFFTRKNRNNIHNAWNRV